MISAPDRLQCRRIRVATNILPVPGRCEEVDHSISVCMSIDLSLSSCQQCLIISLVTAFESVVSSMAIKACLGEAIFVEPAVVRQAFRRSIDAKTVSNRESPGNMLDCTVFRYFIHTLGTIKLSGFDIMSPLSNVFNRSYRGSKISLSGCDVI